MKKYRIKRVYDHPNYLWIPQSKKRWGLFWSSWTQGYSDATGFQLAFPCWVDAREFIKRQIEKEKQEANPNNRTAYFDV